MWYHFAFVAISVALFGMTVGALLVYLSRAGSAIAAAKQQLWVFSLLFAVSVPSASSPSSDLPFDPRLGIAGVARSMIVDLPGHLDPVRLQRCRRRASRSPGFPSR